ncbi:hypothetical protein [Streptomyces sp. CBMA152]|uniref:hypothetical protein n=1 Tax=Streptomyces sp. CBMA152 TaxID=1896312 RepID=UPI0016610A1B|nr:hypothetical protein [Streptomyces sp. CBMA152]MBD0743554.1 hypothetical protein [Streptomyces sp. CBMA152]
MDDVTPGARYAHCAALWAKATVDRAKQAHELDGMAARSLHKALASMSPDTDIAARVMILTPGGDFAGFALLSLDDVERLQFAAGHSKAMQAETVDGDKLIADFEAYLRNGGDL